MGHFCCRTWRGLCRRTAIPKVSVRVRSGHCGWLCRHCPSLWRDDGFHDVVETVVVLSPVGEQRYLKYLFASVPCTAFGLVAFLQFGKERVPLFSSCCGCGSAIELVRARPHGRPRMSPLADTSMGYQTKTFSVNVCCVTIQYRHPMFAFGRCIPNICSPIFT